MLSVELQTVDNSVENEAGFTLADLQHHMKKIKFFGSATILWQNGEIIMIRTEQTIKPTDFNKVLIQGIY